MFEQLLSTISRKVYPPFPEGIPGPQTLATGNPDIGFFGEVSGTDFINYADMAALVGITVGTNPNPNGTWLKLAYNGTVQFIPKLAARSAVSWATMNSLGIVTKAQNKLVTIKDKTYRVRLINGSNTNPYPSSANDENGMLYGTNTEWSKLFYGLASSVIGVSNLEGPVLADYSLADLGLNTGLGRSTIIQEITTGSLQIARGNASTNMRGLFPFSNVANTDTIRGWRPVVEYVSG